MRFRWLLLANLVMVCCAVGPCATAQTARQHPQDPRHFDAPSAGNTIELGPNWLFQQGDNPAWAAPGFDDSRWPVINAGKRLEDQGYSNINQIWYRAHVRVEPTSGPLDLGVESFHGSYEVFVNGVRVGGEGSLSGQGELRSRPLILFGIPKQAMGSGELAIAIHGATGKYPYRPRPSIPGVFASTHIVLGGHAALAPRAFSSYIVSATILWVLVVLVSFVAMVVLTLYRAMPDQQEYLAIAVCGGFRLLSLAENLLVARLRLPIGGVVWGLGELAYHIFWPLQYEVVLRLIGVRPPRWVRVFQVLMFSAGALLWLNSAGIVPSWVHQVAYTVAELGLDIGVPVFLFREMGRGNRDAPVLLAFQIVSSCVDVLAQTGVVLAQFHLVSSTTVFVPPLRIGLYSFQALVIAEVYFWVTLLVIIVLRTVRTSREKAEIAAEIAAARTVQQVLIPDFLPPVAGLTIESAYIPAQEVGGDFFQVLPIPGGDAFVVVGDVSGKGLKAAMTVSLIVGTLRTLAEYVGTPAEMLAGINRRLEGRDAGFATCLVLKITPEGDVTIANAGHPNPYLDGVEVPTESNLPLGITLDVAYAETRLHIDAGQSFALVTDGVVEATAATTRELFGFERTQAISRQAANAIAEAARAFGIGAPQADDITVLTVARTAA